MRGRALSWALIVVDMQNDFLTVDGYYGRRAALDESVREGRLSHAERLRELEFPEPPTSGSGCVLRSPELAAVVDRVCSAVRLARRAARPVAFVRAVYDRSFAVQPPSLLRDPTRRHFPCKTATWGCDFVDSIASIATEGESSERESVIDKHTFDGFHRTELAAFLGDHEVDAVVVAGVETDVCVLRTAQSSSILGYRTLIAEDAVWTANTSLGLSALAIFRDAFGESVRVEQIPEALTR